MTGEITLRGRVLGVGGIKEKSVAALREGIRQVLLPAANEPDLEQLPDEVRAGVDFLPVRDMDEVIEAALTESPTLRTKRAGDLIEGSASAGLGLSQ